MTEKERKHQHYLDHKDEYKTRAQRWAEAHREQRAEQAHRSLQKRMDAMTDDELAEYKRKRSDQAKDRRRQREANETPEEREARLAHNRQRDKAYRRAHGIGPRPPRKTEEELKARSREYHRRLYYERHDSDEDRKQYERDRKRVYRARLRNNPS